MNTPYRPTLPPRKGYIEIAGEYIRVDIPEDNEVAELPLRERKYVEFDSACSAAIVMGFNVKTTHGARHYNLDISDQNNLDNVMNTIRDVKLGLRPPEIIANGIPFKMADGDCLYYTEQDIKNIDLYRMGHILYERTYLSALLSWCATLADDELAGIVYGTELPAAYKAHVDAIMEPLYKQLEQMA